MTVTSSMTIPSPLIMYPKKGTWDFFFLKLVKQLLKVVGLQSVQDIGVFKAVVYRFQDVIYIC